MQGERNRLEFCLFVVFALLIAASPLHATVIPAEKEHVISLDGTWRFKLEQAKGKDLAPGEHWTSKLPIDYPETFEPFHQPSYDEDNGWVDIEVPGNWEIPGHSPATYNQPDNASGFYRHTFEVPKSWEGRIVKINFDGVQNGAEIWLNGKPVKCDEPSWGRENYHEGGWTAFQIDLTPHVKFGEKNLLALRVTKNTRSADLDSGDYFFLGGVHRPVTLFAVPKNHLHDVKVETRLLEAGKAEVKVIADVPGAHGGSVSLRLQGVEGAAEAKVENDRAVVTKVVENAKLWSAEFPNLYPMTVELKDDAGKTVQRATQKIGIREITIKDAVLLVNGVPVKFAGMCRHDHSPHEGTATNPEIWRKDILLMKAANVNAIRTSHYPYGKGFYDLCDELGMYVMDELPYCWTPTDDKEMEPAFLQRARETIARDKNHPCVVLWAIGNENKEGQNLQAVADLVKELDATRPRAVSWFGGAKYNVELSDSHYTRPENIEKAGIRAREVGRPHIYLENPNNWEVRLGADPGAWKRWAPVLQRCWDVVTEYDTIPGTFLWEWADRAVADKSPIKLYYFFPETGINLLKIKGITDPFRNPRPWYYDVKMIYSPIRFGEKVELTGDKATFSIENRYSFTDLSHLQPMWQLLRDGKPIGGDRKTAFKVSCPPLSQGKVVLRLPADHVKQADTLRIDFVHPARHHVVAHQFALKEVKPESRLTESLPAGLEAPQFNLITRKTERDPQVWRKVTRYPAKLTNVRMTPASASAGSAKTMSGDIVGGPDGAVVGTVHATLAGNEFKYTMKWTGPEKTEVQEFGWAFVMPKDFNRFSWDRQARWTVYPDKHIGRPTGTATHESMNVPYTKMERPDAFDFNSTKYECNAASLTNGSGEGFRVEFDPKQRFHCRGGVTEEGNHVLYVNQQVSPPDDLSSNVVRDLYMTLNPGDVIEGSFKIGSNAR
ncbi:MAG TPA: glycoside hydrolase family 2 TIM barrel-domain containing protein [Tepidisphaeraceae bacterium]|nr:glycoside hydrolase family 2 TIM barrel-domain containing protein [Tepidisphaeraceae bacterium]